MMPETQNKDAAASWRVSIHEAGHLAFSEVVLGRRAVARVIGDGGRTFIFGGPELPPLAAGAMHLSGNLAVAVLLDGAQEPAPGGVALFAEADDGVLREIIGGVVGAGAKDDEPSLPDDERLEVWLTVYAGDDVWLRGQVNTSLRRIVAEFIETRRQRILGLATRLYLQGWAAVPDGPAPGEFILGSAGEMPSEPWVGDSIEVPGEAVGTQAIEAGAVEAGAVGELYPGRSGRLAAAAIELIALSRQEGALVLTVKTLADLDLGLSADFIGADLSGVIGELIAFHGEKVDVLRLRDGIRILIPLVLQEEGE